jgi:hypothetical protein
MKVNDFSAFKNAYPTLWGVIKTSLINISNRTINIQERMGVVPEELKRDPMFHACMQCLLRGDDPHRIIIQLLKTHVELKDVLTEKAMKSEIDIKFVKQKEENGIVRMIKDFIYGRGKK